MIMLIASVGALRPVSPGPALCDVFPRKHCSTDGIYTEYVRTVVPTRFTFLSACVVIGVPGRVITRLRAGRLSTGRRTTVKTPFRRNGLKTFLPDQHLILFTS
jgi:hypothetical protein